MTRFSSRRLATGVTAAALLLAAGCGESDTVEPAADSTADDAADAASATEASTDAPAGTATNASATADGSLDTSLPPLGDEPVEISFESYNFLMEGAGADAMHQLVDEFEAAHPNVTIERRKPTAVEDLMSGLQQQIVAGDPPSLAQVGFSNDLLAQDLGAHSWDDTVGADTLDAFFDGSLHDQHAVHPKATTLGDFEDETYALPFVFSTPTLFINRTVFEAAGLDPDDPPQTWDEVREASTAITESTDAGGIYTACTGPASGGWCYQAMLRSNGNVPISDDRRAIDFDSPEAVEVAEMLNGLVNDGLHIDATEADAADLFMRGDLGMYLQSAVYTNAALDAADANGWEMDATGLPAFGDQPIVPTNSGSGLALFAEDPAEQRAAWELAKHLTSDHGYTVITSQIGYLPLRTGIVEEDEYLAGWLADHEFLQTNLDQLDQLHPWVVAPGASGAQITTIWLDALNEIIYRDADATETLATAQSDAEALMP